MTDRTLTAAEARTELYDVFRSEGSFAEKAENALQLGREYLGADHGFLTEIDQTNDTWEILVSTDPDAGDFAPGIQLNLESTYCHRTIESESSIALHDAAEQGWEDDPAFTSGGYHCYHGTRLVVDGAPFGTVCFLAQDPRREVFSEGETMFAELIAQLIERELENQRHEREYRQQANLATVLNRVLRHNLRNDMAVIRGRTQIMAEQLADDTHSEIALRNIDKLIQLGEKARELESIVADTSEPQTVDLRALIDRVVTTVSDDNPNATISVECSETVSAQVLRSFEQALFEIVENAATHCGESPTITVRIEPRDDTVEIQVSDDGPGLPKQERDVLTAGAETPLVHGSGLGLWLVNWVVSSHDGTIEPTVTPEGTTMAISIPRGVTPTQSSATELTRPPDEYRAAFQAANDAMVITDTEGRILDANETACETYGLSRSDLLGRTVREFFPDDYDAEAEWQAFQSGAKDRDTVTVIGADGEEHVLEYAGTPNVVPGQNLFIARDITGRVEREAELRMKTQAIDDAPIGMTITDPSQADNPMVYANDRFCELTGYDREEILDQNCRFLQGEDTHADRVRMIRDAIDNEESVSTTIRNYRKDGTGFWNHITIAPVTDDNGALTNWIGFQQDVTDRRKREDALEATTDRLTGIVDAAPNPIFALDTEGRVTQWNDASERVFGYTAAEAVGEPITSLDLHTDAQEAAFEQRFTTVLAGESVSQFEITRQTKSGDSVDLRVSPILLRDGDGEPTGVMVVAEIQNEPAGSDR
ncbi:PAS domain S-box protein [Halonotius terrestris]|uniref:PAS domain S-box protein n=1 Tax=Halonotius terrestris TaxID=2487750 RepID=A0A8J8P9Z1_9EURY|nr:PAS domain S-box protein [Halonotius terrestris]TQQ82949.1 PAS domain S-box protein [Halonotius terrestris]